jgi:hypothetical protein
VPRPRERLEAFTYGQDVANDQCSRFPSLEAVGESCGRGRFRREVSSECVLELIEHDRFKDRAPEPTFDSPPPASPNEP